MESFTIFFFRLRAYSGLLLFLGCFLLSSILSVSTVKAQLNGTYTIGGEDGDFGSFTEAIHFLERSFGLDSLVFSVRPGTYHEQLIISAQNFPHVTFQGESGDSTEVVLKYPGDYALRVFGGSNYTFRHMTISGNGAIRMEAVNNIEADHFTFENNILKSTGDAAVVSTYALAEDMGTTNSSVDFLTLRNNYIEGTGWGIQKEGSIIHHVRHGVYTLSDAALEVSGNHLKTGRGGMFISNTRDINIRNNRIMVESNSTSIEPEGIHLKVVYRLKNMNENHIEIKGAAAKGMWMDGSPMGGYFGSNLPDEFNGNKILLRDGGTGILLEWTSSQYPSLMVNNMIAVNGHNGSIGIQMKEAYIKPNFSFNSILLYGDDTDSKVVSLSDSETGTFANNIFANSAGGFAFHAQNSLSNNPGALVSSDYNDFYTSGDMLAHWYGEDVADLNEWQSLTAYDAHSISADPRFESVELLIPANQVLDGAGVSLEEVKTDFFGQMRNDPPDMGAVEFEVSPEVPEATPGFVVGGGVIHSPAGAITHELQWEGRAIFSFHAIQKKKDRSPGGIASLTMPEKDFRFRSVNAYEWMSVNENTAILQGTGSLNGAAGYRFVISVEDKGTGPREPKDTYRMIIWSPEEEVVYDNQRGLPVYAIATRPVDRGNIMVRPEFSPNARISEASQTTEVFQEFKAYPTSLEGGDLWIEIPAHAGTGEGHLSILDRQGSLLAEKRVYQAGKLHWKLNTQNWSPGVYMLIFRTNQQIQTQKLVK